MSFSVPATATGRNLLIISSRDPMYESFSVPLTVTGRNLLIMCICDPMYMSFSVPLAVTGRDLLIMNSRDPMCELHRSVNSDRPQSVNYEQPPSDVV
jgi:hypothetical protein